MTYRIFKETWHDKYGKSSNDHFIIKKKKSFLGRTFWRSIKHEECGYGDCVKVETTFKTEKEAEKFIQNILCKNVPRQKWVSNPIREMSCK